MDSKTKSGIQKGMLSIVEYLESVNFKKNVILFMFKEQLGLGPKYYQLLTSIEPYGRSHIQCLLRLLPHEKMVLRLWSMRFALFKAPLFLNQAEKVQEIIDQRIPLKEL